MTQRLAGKVALVTGGSRGIGAAVVHRLAAEGAKVAFTYALAESSAENVATEVEAAGGSALAIRADSAREHAVEAAVAETVENFGGLDILVANAGLTSVAPLEEFSLAEFDRLVSVNIRGVFTAIKIAATHLDRGGRIITIGSVNADRVPFPGMSVYAMTKAAVAGLTRGLARELGPRGITANTVQPGPTDTDMNPASGPVAEAMKQLLPGGQYARPHDIASAVAYLATPEAHFITGTNWNVDGGYAI